MSQARPFLEAEDFVQLMNSGQYAAAQQALEAIDVGGLLGSRMKAHYQGQLFLRKGEVDRAIQVLQKALKDFGSYLGIQIDLALCYQAKGQTALWQRQLQLIEASLEKYKDELTFGKRIRYSIWLARQLETEGHVAKSLTILEECLMAGNDLSLDLTLNKNSALVPEQQDSELQLVNLQTSEQQVPDPQDKQLSLDQVVEIQTELARMYCIYNELDNVKRTYQQLSTVQVALLPHEERVSLDFSILYCELVLFGYEHVERRLQDLVAQYIYTSRENVGFLIDFLLMMRGKTPSSLMQILENPIIEGREIFENIVLKIYRERGIDSRELDPLVHQISWSHYLHSVVTAAKILRDPQDFRKRLLHDKFRACVEIVDSESRQLWWNCIV